MINKGEELSVRWHYHAGCGALVWQLMFTQTGDLIGQKRVVSSRQALFFGIDTATGKVFCDDYLFVDHPHALSPAESWFTVLETTLGGLVYCSAGQPNSPEHQGIWALDFRSGSVVWSRPDLVFVANLEDEFLVYKPSAFAGFPERHFLLINPLSGVDVPSSGLEHIDVNALRAEVVQEEVRQQVMLPEFVTEGMAGERMALQRAGVPGTTRCECIVHGSLTVAVLHEPAQLPELWDSSLKVWRNDHLVYADTLEESVEKPGLNNFLIRNDSLCYLKAREELVCVALS
jgi:hypothetical protein